MKKTLTGNQQKILEYITSEIQQKGYPPSVREICSAIGLKSTSTVHGHLTRLEKKGYIRRDLTKPRAIEVLSDHSKRAVVTLPLVGRVTAGLPITAIENVEDNFTLPEQLVGKGEHFLLSVKGDSMVEAGILDGDLVIVRKQSSCENGEVIVALIEDEATVKAFYKEHGHIRLQPRNKTMDPIIVRDCSVLGKVVGLLRRM